MDQIWFAEKNVTLITTDLKGTDVADIYADFKFSEDGKEIISCPAGHRPKSNVYDINTQKCKASFPILESYGYEMNAPRSEAVITLICQLQYQSMNQSRKYM